MKLTTLVSGVTHRRDDDADHGERDWTCGRCGTWLRGSWHHCMSCHLTFAALTGFDRHRIGGTAGRREGCSTPEQLIEDGWTCDGDGVWRVPVKEASA